MGSSLPMRPHLSALTSTGQLLVGGGLDVAQVGRVCLNGEAPMRAVIYR